MRTIIINIKQDSFKELARNTDHIDLTEALGYLSLWGITDNVFDTVNIYLDHHSDTDLIVRYTSSTNPNASYTMGAIWRDEDHKFTFHS